MISARASHCDIVDSFEIFAKADGCQVDRRSKQIEDVIQLQRRLNAQMEQLDADAHREIEASIRHETAVNKLMAQSEPSVWPSGVFRGAPA